MMVECTKPLKIGALVEIQDYEILYSHVVRGKVIRKVTENEYLNETKKTAKPQEMHYYTVERRPHHFYYEVATD